MKLQAIQDRVVIRLDERATETSGGIRLVNPVTRQQGTVESVGPWVDDVQVGEKVIFTPYWENVAIKDRDDGSWLIAVKRGEIAGVLE